jgi:predicted outer membrane repeat protein
MWEVRRALLRTVRPVAAIVVVLGTIDIGFAEPAYAAGSNVADCTFSTLQSDLQSGGDWYYTPGQCLSPIAFTGTITIASKASLTAKGNDVTLDGGGSNQLFVVNSGVAFGLTGVTLTRGSATLFGGAIRNEGTLTITASTLSNNSALDGGAIYNDTGGSVSLSDSKLTGNSSSGNNGAIASFGSLTITDSTLSNNHTTPAAGDGQAVGGAISAGGASVTIVGSTFSNNAATGTAPPNSGSDFGQGGAIEYTGCSGCQLSIDSSTFSGNSATGDGTRDQGGAIAASGVVSIQNSTFSGNSTTGTGGAIDADSAGAVGISGSSTLLITASTFAGNAAGQGDAIYNNADSASLAGTIVAANGGGNCAGSAITDQGYNLEWTGSTNTSTGYSCFSAGTSIKGQDPKLGSLADNGGSTQTIALPAGSVATDKIPTGTGFTASSTSYVLCPASGATTDQRGAGYSRPDNGESSCDIGAYEAQDDPTLTTTASGPVIVGGAIHDVAHLSGGFNPTGTITFQVFAPGDTSCSTPLTPAPAGAAVSGTGDYTSGDFTTVVTGGYRWIASYSGDPNNLPVATACNDANETSTAQPATPSLTTAASGPVTVGGAIHDVAHLSGGFNPTGTITFQVFAPGDTSCSTPLTPAPAGAAVSGTGDYTSGDFTTVVTGGYRWIASYSGDANNNAFSTGCNDAGETSTANKASSSISTSQQPASATVGSSIADKATVSGGFNPTGTVTFNLYSNSNGTGTLLFTDTELLSGGTATSKAYTAAAAGTDSWVATYSGDANNKSVMSSPEPVTLQYRVALLYKAPLAANAGKTVPIKLELQKFVNGALVNASSASLGVQALCVVPAGKTDCTSAVINYAPPQAFTFMSSLDAGGGYQFNVKTPATLAKGIYQLLFRANGEPSTTFHAEAGATFSIG